MIYFCGFIVLCLFILRTETYPYRVWLRKLEADLNQIFPSNVKCKYKPSKWRVIERA